MQTIKVLATLGVLTLLGGCVPSLHPLYTEDTLVFLPELVGTWIQAGQRPQEIWTFERSRSHGYNITSPVEDTPGKFEGHLVQLGEWLFLDVFPADSDAMGFFWVPTHTFWKVELNENLLHLSTLDPEWLEDMSEEHKLEIAHEYLDKAIFLTAPSKQLQQFVLKHAADPSAFEDPWEYLRWEYPPKK